jgi:shikimate kinase
LTPGASKSTAASDTVVVITGFMGTGKTQVGEALAGMLALEFVDTDREIETATGRSVSSIFETQGEDHFRALEEKLCGELGKRRGVVIATGGGTLLNEENYRALSTMARLVLLETATELLCERLAKDETRPLLSGAGRSRPFSRNANPRTIELPPGSTPRIFGRCRPPRRLSRRSTCPFTGQT